MADLVQELLVKVKFDSQEYDKGLDKVKSQAGSTGNVVDKKLGKSFVDVQGKIREGGRDFKKFNDTLVGLTNATGRFGNAIGNVAEGMLTGGYIGAGFAAITATITFFTDKIKEAKVATEEAVKSLFKLKSAIPQNAIPEFNLKEAKGLFETNEKIIQQLEAKEKLNLQQSLPGKSLEVMLGISHALSSEDAKRLELAIAQNSELKKLIEAEEKRLEIVSDYERKARNIYDTIKATPTPFLKNPNLEAENKERKREEEAFKNAQKEKLNAQKAFYDSLKFLSSDYYAYVVTQINNDVTRFRQAGIDEIDITKWKNEQLKQLELDRIRFVTDEQKKALTKQQTDFRASLVNVNDPTRNFVGDINSAGKTLSEKAKGETVGFVNVPEISKETKDLTDTTDTMETSFDSMLNAASSIASVLGEGGASFVSALQSAYSLASSIVTIIAGIVNIASGGFLSFLGAHSGGVFQDGKKIAKFAGGGDFVVPSGFSNDSFPMMVESGERVTVTPTGRVGDESKLLASIAGKLDALNKNLVSKNMSPIVNLDIDGKKLVKQVTKPNENRLTRSGFDLNAL